MDDKTRMTAILNNVKGYCDLLMHGSIESSTPAVHSTFKSTLDSALDTQNQIYSKMSAKGWYPQQQAQQQQIESTKQKFRNQA